MAAPGLPAIRWRATAAGSATTTAHDRPNAIRAGVGGPSWAKSVQSPAEPPCCVRAAGDATRPATATPARPATIMRKRCSRAPCPCQPTAQHGCWRLFDAGRQRRYVVLAALLGELRKVRLM